MPTIGISCTANLTSYSTMCAIINMKDPSLTEKRGRRCYNVKESSHYCSGRRAQTLAIQQGDAKGNAAILRKEQGGPYFSQTNS